MTETNVVSHFATYCDGIKIKAVRDVTKDDIVKLCVLLESEMTGSTFRPQEITEGGILIRDKTDEPRTRKYKCLRFQRLSERWPSINGSEMTTWVDNKDVLLRKGAVCPTFLKSFHGAPLFTREELLIWIRCFEQVGLKKHGRQLPSTRGMRNYSRELSRP